MFINYVVLTGNYPRCGSFSAHVCEDYALAPTSPALPESLPPPANIWKQMLEKRKNFITDKHKKNKQKKQSLSPFSDTLVSV